jgi:hypothetical protein
LLLIEGVSVKTAAPELPTGNKRWVPHSSRILA